MGEPATFGLDEELTAPPSTSHLHRALCPCCKGNRYIVDGAGLPRVCTVCHGDGLARLHLAAIADDARLSVDWLT